MLAALANGETLLKGALFSDDSRHFLQCLKDLGFDVVVDEPAHTVRVTGLGGRIPKETAAINVGSAGTAARFLTAMLGCAKGVWHLDASEQMKKRPMAALLQIWAAALTAMKRKAIFLLPSIQKVSPLQRPL